jgi:pimeloyl-ACP methyl ester carboxylesterase
MDNLLLERPKAFIRYFDFQQEGLPLVFLHGLGCASSSDFPRVVADPLLAGRRFVLVDLLGHGYSDRPDQFAYTLEDHADTVSQLLDRLSLTGCAVFGHSMGGAVAITLAALRPDLVSRLILAEANLDPGGGIISTFMAGHTEEEFERRGMQATLERLQGMGFMTSVGTFRVCAAHALCRTAVGLVKGTQPTMRERLYSLDIPRACIFGDRGLPDPDTERLAARGIQVLVVPNAGHTMTIDNPRGVAEALSKALNTSAASA